MSSLKVETFSPVYYNISGLNRIAAVNELGRFMDAYPTDLVALVKTQPNGALLNWNQPSLKSFTGTHVLKPKTRKKGATFIKNGFVVQHLQPQNLANHEFVWMKVMNQEVPLNVIIVYFASGVRPADNEWNFRIRGKLEQIVMVSLSWS